MKCILVYTKTFLIASNSSWAFVGKGCRPFNCSRLKQGVCQQGFASYPAERVFSCLSLEYSLGSQIYDSEILMVFDLLDLCWALALTSLTS